MLNARILCRLGTSQPARRITVFAYENPQFCLARRTCRITVEHGAHGMNIVLAVIDPAVFGQPAHIAQLKSVVGKVLIFGIGHVVSQRRINRLLVRQRKHPVELVVGNRIGALVCHHLKVADGLRSRQFFTACRRSGSNQIEVFQNLGDFGRRRDRVLQVHRFGIHLFARYGPDFLNLDPALGGRGIDIVFAVFHDRTLFQFVIDFYPQFGFADGAHITAVEPCAHSVRIALAVVSFAAADRLRQIRRFKTVVGNVFVFRVRHVMLQRIVNSPLVTEGENTVKTIVGHRIGALISFYREIADGFGLKQAFTGQRGRCGGQRKTRQNLGNFGRSRNTVGQIDRFYISLFAGHGPDFLNLNPGSGGVVIHIVHTVFNDFLTGHDVRGQNPQFGFRFGFRRMTVKAGADRVRVALAVVSLALFGDLRHIRGCKSVVGNTFVFRKRHAVIQRIVKRTLVRQRKYTVKLVVADRISPLISPYRKIADSLGFRQDFIAKDSRYLV